MEGGGGCISMPEKPEEKLHLRKSLKDQLRGGGSPQLCRGGERAPGVFRGNKESRLSWGAQRAKLGGT